MFLYFSYLDILFLLLTM